MRDIFKNLKKAVNAIVIFIQKVLITVSLFLLYFFGFGALYFFCLIFKREAIRGTLKDKATFWETAEDYESDMDEALRQS